MNYYSESFQFFYNTGIINLKLYFKIKFLRTSYVLNSFIEHTGRKMVILRENKAKIKKKKLIFLLTCNEEIQINDMH